MALISMKCATTLYLTISMGSGLTVTGAYTNISNETFTPKYKQVKIEKSKVEDNTTYKLLQHQATNN
ncbi:hypothetical protein [Bacillus mycoides]|uniref:hypothetical protein n=1 Tax=Bacillus mycoides TaxID=1405 RepID=UPI00119F69C0|nr:hypothetical protein [Bacillus mycoides]